MKKYIFIIGGTIILVMTLLYFYDAREEVLNREYIDDDIYIEYPYFNNQVVDSYINNYLNKVIDSSNNYSLFMDYDYDILDGVVNLFFYTYKEKNNMVSRSIKNMEIDLASNYIIDDKNVVDTSLDVSYDLYNQRVIDKDAKMVALTFDDGPNSNTSKVLDILEKYNVKATFFILGTNVEGNEKIIKRMSDLGMEIGNHMYSHKLITRLKDETIKKEIIRVDSLIFDTVGKYPTLVRPSYGTVNKRIKKVIDRPIIIWDIDTLDWKYHNSKRISNNVLKRVSDGDIILMHDIYSATANSLEITIPKLLDDGYSLVTVSELFYYKDMELSQGKSYGSAK